MIKIQLRQLHGQARHMRQRAGRVAAAVDPQPGERWYIPGRGPADVIARDDYQVQFKDAATGRPVFTTLQWLRSWRPLLKPLSLQADAECTVRRI